MLPISGLTHRWFINYAAISLQCNSQILAALDVPYWAWVQKEANNFLTNGTMRCDACHVINVMRDVLKIDGSRLEFLSSKPYELCVIAVGQNPFAIRFVPMQHRTVEICMSAVRRRGECLAYVPLELRTNDLCCLAVIQSGFALKYVPYSLRTINMYRLAVASYWPALKEVPAEVQDQYPDIVCTALELDPCAIQFVHNQTREMCAGLVQRKYSALKYIRY